MRRKSRAFRPTVNDRLEDRTVPSGMGGFGWGGLGFGGLGFGGLGGLLGGLGGSGHGDPGRALNNLLGQLRGILGQLEGHGGFGASQWNKIDDLVTKDVNQVNHEFQTFSQSVASAYLSYLATLPVGSTGTSGGSTASAPSGSSSGADTFQAAVTTAIGTLTTAVNADIANLATGNANLQSSVDAALTALGTSINGLTLPTTLNFRAQSRFVGQLISTIGKTTTSVDNLVRAATPPAGDITQAAYNQAVTDINSGFQAFGMAYNAAEKATATNPATNRAAFDAAVGTALGTLNTSIDTALAEDLPALPAASLTTLEATIQADLLSPPKSSSASSTSTNPTDLQDVLAGLTSPSSSKFSLRFFNFLSQIAIGSAEGHVVKAVTTAVKAQNDSLTASTGTSGSA
jgi:hypothetical protein